MAVHEGFRVKWVWGRGVVLGAHELSSALKLQHKECFYFVLFFFLGLYLQHMEGPWLGVELELPAYTTATAAQDPSHICDLHHSSHHCWIFNPLSEARD